MMRHVGNATYDIVYARQSPNAGTTKISWKSSLRKLKKVDTEHTNIILQFRFHVYAYIPKYGTANTCDLKHFR